MGKTWPGLPWYGHQVWQDNGTRLAQYPWPRRCQRWGRNSWLCQPAFQNQTRLQEQPHRTTYVPNSTWLEQFPVSFQLFPSYNRYPKAEAQSALSEFSEGSRIWTVSLSQLTSSTIPGCCTLDTLVIQCFLTEDSSSQHYWSGYEHNPYINALSQAPFFLSRCSSLFLPPTRPLSSTLVKASMTVHPALTPVIKLPLQNASADSGNPLKRMWPHGLGWHMSLRVQ